jgi:hypothetical protein
MTNNSALSKICFHCLNTLRDDDDITYCDGCEAVYHTTCRERLTKCSNRKCTSGQVMSDTPVVLEKETPVATIIEETPVKLPEVKVNIPPLEDKAENPEIEALLAEMAIRIDSGKLTEIEPRLAKAKGLSPYHPGVLEIEGDYLLAKGQKGRAAICYRQSLDIDPTNSLVEEKYATCLFLNNQPSLAAKLGPNLDFDDPFSVPMKRPPWASALFSALYPSLGQLFNGDWFKGVIIFVVAGILFKYNSNIVYAALQKNMPPGQSTSFFTEINVNTVNTTFATLFSGVPLLITIFYILIWAYSIYDAVVTAKSRA